MWSPVDKSAIPTPEELKKAKGAIEFVQRDLEGAIESLAQAQRLVETLRRDLEERNAWIAPVRILTFDVLSMIFEWCADVEWNSPVRIAAVSRTWRTIVLDTPRAWSFADLSSGMSVKGVSMFFERSRERPLHVHLPRHRPYDLTSVAHRIHTLFLNELSGSPQVSVFPNVQRLSIFGCIGILLADVTTHRFPALLHLVTVGTKLYHKHGSIDANFSFPRLKSWSLRTCESIAWVDGLRICSNTLVSLTIYDHSYSIMDHRPPILLPLLNCLTLMTGHVSRGGFNLKTPRLETYREETDILEGPVHTDVSTVTQMRFIVKGLPSLSLSCFQSLKRLQIYNGSGDVINSALDQLLADRGLCPALQIIELYPNIDIAPYSKRLPEINSGRAHAIDLVVLTEPTKQLCSCPVWWWHAIH